MEELLNKLIQRWWKPFGWQYYDRFIIESNWDMCFRWQYPWTDWTHSYDYNFDYFKIRDLVSKESGLWQFVCENGMIRVTEGNSLCNWLFWEEIYYDETQTDKLYKNDNYEYWLIESALCDEDKLEKFLLDNIKI